MKKILSSIALTAMMTSNAFSATSIEGTGASFPYPVYKAWISEYYGDTGNKVNYSPTGSGTGVKEISARHVDFGGTDSPLKPSDLAKKKLIQFPTVVGAITISYNLPGINNLKLSETSISGIVLGTVEYWDAASLQSDNPGVKLPHEKILFVHRSDKSGTTFNFSYYLSKMNSQWAKQFGAKKLINWPMANRVAGKGNFGVSTAIKTNPYSIGYVDFADARENKLDMAVIEDAAGKFVEPTVDNFIAASAGADLDPKKSFYAVIAYPDAGYPIITATFALLPEEGEKNKAVTEFFAHSYKNGDKAASELGYIPLPESLKQKVAAYWTAKGIK